MKSTKSMGHEERAISDLLQNLGYTISSRSQEDQRRATRGLLSLDSFTTYTISNKMQSVQQYDVICVNAYTKKPDRAFEEGSHPSKWGKRSSTVTRLSSQTTDSKVWVGSCSEQKR